MEGRESEREGVEMGVSSEWDGRSKREEVSEMGGVKEREGVGWEERGLNSGKGGERGVK